MPLVALHSPAASASVVVHSAVKDAAPSSAPVRPFLPHRSLSSPSLPIAIAQRMTMPASYQQQQRRVLSSSMPALSHLTQQATIPPSAYRKQGVVDGDDDDAQTQPPASSSQIPAADKHKPSLLSIQLATAAATAPDATIRNLPQRQLLMPPSLRRTFSEPRQRTSQRIQFTPTLGNVRFFRRNDKPLDINAPGWVQADEAASPLHQDQLQLVNVDKGCYSAKGSSSILLRGLPQAFGTHTHFQGTVAIESLRVSPLSPSFSSSSTTPFVLSGVVHARNLAFEKEVCLRYTTDFWRSHHNINATYVGPAPNHDQVDKFAFELDLASLATTSPSSAESVVQEQVVRMWFCVCYTVAGNTHWDNNDGRNYELVVRRVAAASPLRVMSEPKPAKSEYRPSSLLKSCISTDHDEQPADNKQQSSPPSPPSSPDAQSIAFQLSSSASVPSSLSSDYKRSRAEGKLTVHALPTPFMPSADAALVSDKDRPLPSLPSPPADVPTTTTTAAAPRATSPPLPPTPSSATALTYSLSSPPMSSVSPFATTSIACPAPASASLTRAPSPLLTPSTRPGISSLYASEHDHHHHFYDTFAHFFVDSPVFQQHQHQPGAPSSSSSSTLGLHFGHGLSTTPPPSSAVVWGASRLYAEPEHHHH
ncbi:Protein phosphatase 1 regulatory subunit 3D [Sorochytrium milnesiophthora]